MTRARLAAAFAACILTGTVAQADEGAIEYRQNVYSAIGGHMSAMAGIAKNEVPHDQDLGIHARGLAELAPLTMHLFPEGSGDGRTKARAAIWEEPDAFAEKRRDFIDAAGALAEIDPADRGAFMGAFRELGGTCKACHDDYKAD